jgi:hypothetical protein
LRSLGGDTVEGDVDRAFGEGGSFSFAGFSRRKREISEYEMTLRSGGFSVAAGTLSVTSPDPLSDDCAVADRLFDMTLSQMKIVESAATVAMCGDRASRLPSRRGGGMNAMSVMPSV